MIYISNQRKQELHEQFNIPSNFTHEDDIHHFPNTPFYKEFQLRSTREINVLKQPQRVQDALDFATGGCIGVAIGVAITSPAFLIVGMARLGRKALRMANPSVPLPLEQKAGTDMRFFYQIPAIELAYAAHEVLKSIEALDPAQQQEAYVDLKQNAQSLLERQEQTTEAKMNILKEVINKANAQLSIAERLDTDWELVNNATQTRLTQDYRIQNSAFRRPSVVPTGLVNPTYAQLQRHFQNLRNTAEGLRTEKQKSKKAKAPKPA